MPARIDPDVARQIMLDADFEPLEPYVNSSTPWRGVCLVCRAEGSPRLNGVRRGQGACVPCGVKKIAAGSRVNEKDAVAVMRAANLEPLQPYKNSKAPWKCRCLECGRTVHPRYNGVHQGQGGCNDCGQQRSIESRRLDESVAVAVMREGNLEPLEPYTSALTNWKCECMVCGATVYPKYAQVQQGLGGCWDCGQVKKSDALRIDESVAVAAMLAVDFEPLEPYPNSTTPWRGVCRVCGTEGTPMLSGVLNGQGACRPCGYRKAADAQRLDPDDARQEMLDAGFEPEVPYTDTKTPWPGKCLTCGKAGAPTLGAIRGGQGACGYCVGKVVDPGDAYDLMIAANFKPHGPYVDSKAPWPGVCLVCDAEGSPTYGGVRNGQGACLPCGNRASARTRLVDEDHAVSVMIAANFKPLEPYQHSHAPWRGVCLVCGKETSPTYGRVRDGIGACKHCAQNFVEPQHAYDVMIQAGFKPDGPYTRSHDAWPGQCLQCGKKASPTYKAVSAGHSPCRACAVGGGYTTEQPGTFYIVRSKTIVKGGISNKAELRIQAHARQGLDTVVARIDSTNGLLPPMLEREWMAMVQRHPDQHLMKTDLEDGYTESLWRNRNIDRQVRAFLKRHDHLRDGDLAA